MGAAPREAAKDGGEEGLRSGELSVLLWASPSEGSPQAPHSLVTPCLEPWQQPLCVSELQNREARPAHGILRTCQLQTCLSSSSAVRNEGSLSGRRQRDFPVASSDLDVASSEGCLGD